MRQNTPFRDELGEVGRLALPLVVAIMGRTHWR